MGTSNFAVFVDLENVGAKESMLLSIIEKVKIRGDILLGKCMATRTATTT